MKNNIWVKGATASKPKSTNRVPLSTLNLALSNLGHRDAKNTSKQKLPCNPMYTFRITDNIQSNSYHAVVGNKMNNTREACYFQLSLD